MMNGNLIADVLYSLVLYAGLATLAVPVVFFLFWSFLRFFRRHKWVFYVLAILFFSAVPAFFYSSRNEWLLWYYAFPSYIQITGLFLLVCSLLIMRLADHHLGLKLRFFWPVLKGDSFGLITGGLYKVVRHPIYSLLPVMLLGALLYTGEWMLLFPLFFNLLTRGWYARKEEAYIKGFAGGDYESYKMKTPNRFYPRLLRIPKLSAKKA